MPNPKDTDLPVCIDLPAFANAMEKRDSRIPKMVNGIGLVQACLADIHGAISAIDAFKALQN